MPSSKIVIIAVHGTFAPDASWAQQGSYLHRALLSLLGKPVNWIPFRWGSGSNSHEARLSACTDLAEVIKDVAQTFQGSRIFVIAHSHGGNVALMALARLAPKCPVAGLACFSTPYISAQPRKSTESEKHDQNIGLLLGMLMPALFTLAFSAAVYALFGDVLAVIAFFGGLPLYIWLLVKCVDHLNRSDNEDKARQGRLIRAYHYREIATPILSLRTTLDEAYWLVRVMSIIGFAPILLHISTDKLISVISVLVIVYGLISGEAAFLILGLVLWVAGTCLWLAGLYWRGLFRLPSWGERITDGFAVKFSMSTEPPPNLFAVCRVLRAQSTFASSLLRHSRLYNSLQAAQVVASFIQGDLMMVDTRSSTKRGDADVHRAV